MNEPQKLQNWLGFSWLAAMLNTFFYLPAGLMFLMYYLLHQPLQQTTSKPLLLLASVACLLVWVNSVLLLMGQSYLAKQSKHRVYIITALPLFGLAAGALGLVIVLVIFGQNGFS